MNCFPGRLFFHGCVIEDEIDEIDETEGKAEDAIDETEGKTENETKGVMDETEGKTEDDTEEDVKLSTSRIKIILMLSS